MTYTLPYEPDDDDQADRYINMELRNPTLERWRAMTTDKYIVQTARVLKATLKTIEYTFARKNGELAAIRAQFAAGEISNQLRRKHVDAYNEWKFAALVFKSRATQRRDQIMPRVLELTGDSSFQYVQETLLTLARAVDEHRRALTIDRKPTPADQALWARLHTLHLARNRTAPGDKPHTVPLAEAIALESKPAAGAAQPPTFHHPD